MSPHQQARDFHNELSGSKKVSAKLLAVGRSLRAKRDPLKRLLKKVQSDVNEARRQNGVPPVDFDKEIQDGVQRLQSAVSSALEENGVKLARSSTTQGHR